MSKIDDTRSDESGDTILTCDCCAEAGPGRIYDPNGVTICPACAGDHQARLRRAAAAIADEFGYALSDDEDTYDTAYWIGVAARVLNAYEGVEDDDA